MASLSAPLRWLCHASNLPECCMVSVLTSTINATAGKSALAGFYRNGEAKETEIILSILISTFPIAFGEYVFLVQAPISIALLGLKVGTAYVLLNLFSSFLQSFSALVYSRLTRPSQTCSIGRQDGLYGPAHESGCAGKYEAGLRSGAESPWPARRVHRTSSLKHWCKDDNYYADHLFNLIGTEQYLIL